MAETAKRRGTVREMHRELTRSRLADAAVECFSAKGYVATTIDDITSAAGTTRATFYLHFKSKADVVLEVNNHLNDEYQPIFAALFELAEAPHRVGVRAWLDETIRVWERTRSASAAVTEAAMLEPSVHERQRASFDRDIDLLSTALQKGSTWTPDEAKARALLMFTQLQQLFMRFATHGWDVKRDEVLEVLTDMWCAALALGPDAS